MKTPIFPARQRGKTGSPTQRFLLKGSILRNYMVCVVQIGSLLQMEGGSERCEKGQEEVNDSWEPTQSSWRKLLDDSQIVRRSTGLIKQKRLIFFVLHPEHQLWRKPVTAHHLRGECKGLKLRSISWDFDSKHHSSCDSDFRVQEVKTPDYFLNSAFMGRQLCYGQTRVTTENLNKCRRVLKHLV